MKTDGFDFQNLPDDIQIHVLNMASPYEKIKLLRAEHNILTAYVEEYPPWERWVISDFKNTVFNVDQQWINDIKAIPGFVLDVRKLFYALSAINESIVKNNEQQLYVFMKLVYFPYALAKDRSFPKDLVLVFRKTKPNNYTITLKEEEGDRGGREGRGYDLLKEIFSSTFEFKKKFEMSGLFLLPLYNENKTEIAFDSPERRALIFLVYHCLVAGCQVDLGKSYYSHIYIGNTINPIIASCAHCKAPSEGICKGCNTVGYCSINCQKMDWKAGHESKCGTPK